jgi:hypothetical protein
MFKQLGKWHSGTMAQYWHDFKDQAVEYWHNFKDQAVEYWHNFKD